MEYNILAKSALKVEELLSKKECGAKNIEIQLLENFLEEKLDYDKYIKMIKQSGLNIVAVHTPITKQIDIEVERLIKTQNKAMFFKTCSLAESFAEQYNKNILVIIHISWSMEEFLIFSDILKEVNDILIEALEKYKNIEIGIENVIPLEQTPDKLFTRNGYQFDNVEFVNYFKSIYETSRIGTVLDTCHIITTLRFMEALVQCGAGGTKNLNLEAYFEKNKDTVKLIHLANVKELGLKKNTHGTPFEENKKDINTLREIFKFYNKYKYKCPITIEVFEVDYRNSLNYMKMLGNIQKI